MLLSLSLLEMSEYCGVDADSITLITNSIFNSEQSLMKMILEDYNIKMVSAPADGFLTQLETGCSKFIAPIIALNWLVYDQRFQLQ